MPQGMKKGVIFNSIGVFIGTTLLLVFNIIAARTLGPSGYGLLNVLYSLILTVTPLLSRGIRDSIVKFISEFEAKKEKSLIFGTIKNGLTAMSIFLAIFLVISLILKDTIQLELFDKNFFLFIMFIVSVSLHSLVDYMQGIFQGFREFKLNAIVVITLRFSMVLFLVLALVIFGGKVKEGSISLALAPFVTLVIAYVLFSPLRARFARSPGNIESKEFWRFMIPVAFIGFFNMFLLRSGPLIIKTLGGIDANKIAGLFSGAFTLISPVRMVVMALLESLFPHLSRVEAMKDKKLIQRYIQKSALFIVIISATVILGYFSLGPILLRFVYGQDFVLEGIHFLLIALLTSSYLVALFLSRILLAKGYAGRTLLSYVVSLFVLFLFISFAPCHTLIRTELALFLANVVAIMLMLYFWKATIRSHPKQT